MTPETRCPWCDGSDLRPQARDGLAWMLCLDCGATGPNAPLRACEVTPTEERRLAVAAWDRRAATPGPGAIARAAEATYDWFCGLRRWLQGVPPRQVMIAEVARILAAELGAGDTEKEPDHA
jgi:hypothetical protein